MSTILQLQKQEKINHSEKDGEPRKQVPKEGVKREEGWQEIFKILLIFYKILPSVYFCYLSGQHCTDITEHRTKLSLCFATKNV